MRVVVAMSGGVDSSTCAALVKEAGHEVIGLAMKTHRQGEARGSRACCTPEDMCDAREVADRLDIPFYLLDYADLFTEAVVQPFADAYRAGRTPNPCIECNDKVKFKPLLERAALLGADKLATGHYARVEARADGSFALGRGRDPQKDQSYFLYRLGQAQLAKTLFPVGELDKETVRAHARRLGLPVSDKRESQEICFVGAEGYAAVVARHGGAGKAGVIVDGAGRQVGRHDGVHQFTLGQRRGLGPFMPHAPSEPLYVVDLDAETGTVRLGSREDLDTHSIEVAGLSFVGVRPEEGALVQVQQRYRETGKGARLSWLGADRIQLTFTEPASRGAPGQAAVLYDGEWVVGGGVIEPRSAAEKAATRLRVLAPTASAGAEP